MNNTVLPAQKAIIIISGILFLTLCLVTAFSVFMPRPLKSSDLTERKQEIGNVIRMDYVDASGRITFASDKGYATRVETLEYASGVTQSDKKESSGDGELCISQSVFTYLDED